MMYIGPVYSIWPVPMPPPPTPSQLEKELVGTPAEGQVSRSDLIARLMPPSPPTPSQLEKELVGTPAEGQVSRSDLIALAGAAAVAVCGGPRIAVPIGRPDASGPDPGMLLYDNTSGVCGGPRKLFCPSGPP